MYIWKYLSETDISIFSPFYNNLEGDSYFQVKRVRIKNEILPQNGFNFNFNFNFIDPNNHIMISYLQY